MVNPRRTIQLLLHLDAHNYHGYRVNAIHTAIPETQHPYRPAPLLLEEKGPGDEVHRTIEQRATTDYYTPYTFSAKERDLETGYSYFGARYYDPNVSVWLSVDPLADKYPSMSAYMYCAGNPVMLVDPDGRTIDPASLEEWSVQKKAVQNVRDDIKGRIDKLTAKALKRGWSNEKLGRKKGDLDERLSHIDKTIETMNTMENSSQGYSITKTNSGIGEISYNLSTNNIDINFGSTASFVHEITHAGQFESGDVLFSRNSGGILSDLHDEVSAYKAQFAYDWTSLVGIASINKVASFSHITPGWVSGVTVNGVKIYDGLGLNPININSTKRDLIQAYPWSKRLHTLPNDYILKNDPQVIYKK